MEVRKTRPKQRYVVYVENKTLKFGTSFWNQLKQFMKFVKVPKQIIRKFSVGQQLITLNEEECLFIFDKLRKLTNVTKNKDTFEKFVEMSAQGYILDVKGMTIIRDI